MMRACQVWGPTMPSTRKGISEAMAAWKARTLASVLGPKIPSTASKVPGRPDRLRKLS